MDQEIVKMYSKSTNRVAFFACPLGRLPLALPVCSPCATLAARVSRGCPSLRTASWRLLGSDLVGLRWLQQLPAASPTCLQTGKQGCALSRAPPCRTCQHVCGKRPPSPWHSRSRPSPWTAQTATWNKAGRKFCWPPRRRASHILSCMLPTQSVAYPCVHGRGHDLQSQSDGRG